MVNQQEGRATRAGAVLGETNVLYSYIHPKAFALVVENASGPVELTRPEAVISGPAIVNASSVAFLNRPGVYGPVTFAGVASPSFGSVRDLYSLVPSPTAPCYPEACPYVDLGIAWRTQRIDTTRLRGNRDPETGVLWNNLVSPAVNRSLIWPMTQVQTGTQTRCFGPPDDRECEDVPVYTSGPLDEDIEVLELREYYDPTRSPAMEAVFYTESGKRITLYYSKDQNGTFWMKMGRCEGCAPDSSFSDWKQLQGVPVIGNPNRRIKALRLSGQQFLTVDTYVFSNGDVKLLSNVYPFPNACGLFSSVPGAPPMAACKVKDEVPRFHLDAGENGTIEAAQVPLTIVGYLSGKRLVNPTPDQGHVRVVGGAYLVEGFQGTFQFYHDPNQAREVDNLANTNTPAGFALRYLVSYAASKVGSASAWTPYR